MNKEVVINGVNCFLANSNEEWISALGQLIQDSKLRADFVAAGRKKILKTFTLDGNFKMYKKMAALELRE